jgi:hypothetical protein
MGSPMDGPRYARPPPREWEVVVLSFHGRWGRPIHIAEARDDGVARRRGDKMKAMRTIGTVVVLSVTAGLVLACNDRGRTPTDPAIDVEQAGASFSGNGGRGNDGTGSSFKLFGKARMTRDPENRANVVLEVVSDGATPVGASRDLKNVQLWQLDHQLNFHRAFVAPHSCGGGSPRIILLIDSDGDGDRDFSANGHVRPPFAACETSTPTGDPNRPSRSTLVWRFEDVTDEQTRWEITGGTVPNFPAFPGATWDMLEQLVSSAFPNHRVLRGILLEDFNNTGPGTSYYDLITIFDLTLGTRGQTQPERRGRDDDSDSEN